MHYILTSKSITLLITNLLTCKNIVHMLVFKLLIRDS